MDRLSYEVVVVGGGPAGLTTALYTTRLGHRTAVFEREGGRHAAVEDVHNLLGVSEDVSGRQLSELGVGQLEEYGGDFYPDAVRDIRAIDGEDGGGEPNGEDGDDTAFLVEAAHATVATDSIVLATGFTDESPDVPGLERFAGRGLHYCLHCDAYTLGDGSVFVLGHDDHAAEVALLMLNFTDDVDLLLNGRTPKWDDTTERQLAAHPLDLVETEVEGAFPETDDGDDPWLGGLSFAGGSDREYLGGFAMYGKEYNVSLAESLGCELTDDGGVSVDDRGRTTVDGVYAVGDVTHGQNQTSVAIGDGARAGIALHKNLREYPLSVEDLDGETSSDDLDVPGGSADVRARMRRDRERETHAGLREPAPDG